MNLVRQVLAAVVLGALAASLAHAGPRERAGKQAHARHHHRVAGPAAAGRTREGVAAPVSADRPEAHPNGTDAVAHKDRAAAGNRGRHGSRDRGEGTASNGRANAGPHASHEINPDLIWTPRPAGRNANRGLGRPGAAKKAAAARPAAPSINRRQRPDAGAAAAKNAIGIAIKPTSVNPAAAGRSSAGPYAVGGAVKANAIGAQVGLTGLSPSAPGGAGKIAPGIAPANAAHPAAPVPSAYGGRISGTGMGRPGVAPGAIGGPAKVVAGVSGTGLRPKK